MLAHSAILPLYAALLLAASPCAGLGQASASTAPDPFAALDQQPNDLARYAYLTKLMPALDPVAKPTAEQLRASAENELGLYRDAIRDFPFDNRVAISARMVLPQRPQWASANALETIVKLAGKRRVVMINEVHHDASTRQLTLALLPRLRALGYRYFAAEALDEKDPALMQRGYPVAASGSEYLHEPLYGEIVRQAIQLGYIVVPYDSDAESTAAREDEQARHLYQRVLAKNPDARLFVHAGYAHVDKAIGNLGAITPMAMRLAQLCHCDPLSIDQSQLRDIGSLWDGAYRLLAEDFQPESPVVLVNSAHGGVWSSDPAKHDISVILPPIGQRQRPLWLTLGGQRRAVGIDVDLCRQSIPCTVEARYAAESDEATPADRYAFLSRHARSTLYLRPGAYRLRAQDVDGKTLSEQTIQVVDRH